VDLFQRLIERTVESISDIDARVCVRGAVMTAL